MAGQFAARLAQGGEIAGLSHCWDEHRRGRPMPLRRDLDLDELRPWIGNINIVDVEWPGPRFHCRLFGTEVAVMLGADMTGCLIDSRLCALGRGLGQGYETVVATRQPVFDRIDRLTWALRDPVFRLVLPFGPCDGTISTIVEAIYPARLL